MKSPALEPEVRPEPTRLLIILGVAVSVMHIWFNVVSVLSSLWQNSLHFAGFALIASLVYPLRKNPTLAWRLLDVLLGLLAASSALYLIAMEDAIYERGVRLATSEWAAGIILILCTLEFTRRVAGWFIPVLIIVSLSYVGWWGQHISGVFKFAGLSMETILFRSVYGDDAREAVGEDWLPAPHSPYGVTKLAAEHLATECGCRSFLHVGLANSASSGSGPRRCGCSCG